MKELKQRRQEVNEDYVIAFCQQHDMGSDFDTHWIGGRDDVVEIGDYYIPRDVLIYAVENNTPEKEFFEWYDYDLTVGVLDLPKHINFESWCKGAPKPYSEDDFAKIREARALVREAEDRLRKCIDELNNKEF